MSSHFTPFTLKDISRPGGGFAMLAVDQREAMRLMFAVAGQPKPIADSVLTDFKVAATRILSPYASAVLADKQFCLEQIVEQGAVANSCGLIVAADLFIPGNGIPVDSVEIDMSVDPHKAREMGAKAMKLLVLWREDEPAEERLAMVDKFVRRCRSAGQRLDTGAGQLIMSRTQLAQALDLTLYRRFFGGKTFRAMKKPYLPPVSNLTIR